MSQITHQKTCKHFKITVNIEMFALYIFTRNFRILNIHENIYTMKITLIAYRASYPYNVNFDPRKIAHFHKTTEIYTKYLRSQCFKVFIETKYNLSFHGCATSEASTGSTSI